MNHVLAGVILDLGNPVLEELYRCTFSYSVNKTFCHCMTLEFVCKRSRIRCKFISNSSPSKEAKDIVMVFMLLFCITHSLSLKRYSLDHFFFLSENSKRLYCFKTNYIPFMVSNKQLGQLEKNVIHAVMK